VFWKTNCTLLIFGAPERANVQAQALNTEGFGWARGIYERVQRKMEGKRRRRKRKRRNRRKQGIAKEIGDKEEKEM
jgi:hypothetical protein